MTVSLPHINQLYPLVCGRPLDPNFSTGEGSLEVELIGEDKMRCTQMAFAIVTEVLKLYFADRQNGSFLVRMLVIVHEGGGLVVYRVRHVSPE